MCSSVLVWNKLARQTPSCIRQTLPSQCACWCPTARLCLSVPEDLPWNHLWTAQKRWKLPNSRASSTSDYPLQCDSSEKCAFQPKFAPRFKFQSLTIPYLPTGGSQYHPPPRKKQRNGVPNHCLRVCCGRTQSNMVSKSLKVGGRNLSFWNSDEPPLLKPDAWIGRHEACGYIMQRETPLQQWGPLQYPGDTGSNAGWCASILSKLERPPPLWTTVEWGRREGGSVNLRWGLILWCPGLHWDKLEGTGQASHCWNKTLSEALKVLTGFSVHPGSGWPRRSDVRAAVIAASLTWSALLIGAFILWAVWTSPSQTCSFFQTIVITFALGCRLTSLPLWICFSSRKLSHTEASTIFSELWGFYPIFFKLTSLTYKHI